MPSLAAKQLKSPTLWLFLAVVAGAIGVGKWIEPTWLISKAPLLPQQSSKTNAEIVFVEGDEVPTSTAIPIEESPITLANLNAEKVDEGAPAPMRLVYETQGENEAKTYFLQSAHRHWGLWSFLPALTAIALCWITKEPITALLGGIVVGAMLVQQYNVINAVLIPSIGTPRAATILILYLWLLGGLMGMWAKTGASEAFADYMSANFVRGPKSAKLVAWLLGVIFFQGGTVSAVLVGTTVRPMADEEKVSHEELSLIVDSTSSPIAVLLAFNAWPVYVQAFMGVAGVSYLATKDDRLAFFFHSIPLSFYALFAVLATFLIAIEKHPLLPKKLLAARTRARTTGELNAPNAEPLANEDPNYDFVAPGYTPNLWDFALPLVVLLAVAIGTFVAFDAPDVLWAFAAALLLSTVLAWWNGMKLQQIINGVLEGMQGVVLGSVILLLAITVGNISKDVGGGHYLVSLLGDLQMYWLLPATAFVIAVVIAFSTGTSWATFAVAMPLVMPLAHAIATNQGLAHPELFMSLCFIACLNGGVFGDQCSPISDTTILSSMCTGADLMDHVKTQIPVASQAALLAVIGWTAIAWYCA